MLSEIIQNLFETAPNWFTSGNGFLGEMDYKAAWNVRFPGAIVLVEKHFLVSLHYLSLDTLHLFIKPTNLHLWFLRAYFQAYTVNLTVNMCRLDSLYILCVFAVAYLHKSLIEFLFWEFFLFKLEGSNLLRKPNISTYSFPYKIAKIIMPWAIN